MLTMTLEEAQTHLAEVIAKLAPGEEITITRDARPVAKLIGQSGRQPSPVFGRGEGKVVIVAEDDDHLRDFEDYMP